MSVLSKQERVHLAPAHIHPNGPCCTITGMGYSDSGQWRRARAGLKPSSALLFAGGAMLWLAGCPVWAAPPAALPAAGAVDTPPKLKASSRILVEPLGFVAPGHFYLPYRIHSATLDFLDAKHLLFTFHAAKLMRREPDDPKEDLDQTVRALVLGVPDGKIEAEGTWRLHDRGPYLWMLGHGHFVMRQRDTLFLGDKTLSLMPYLHAEGAFISAQLSPDGGMLLAQYAKALPDDNSVEGDGRPAGAPTLGPSLNGTGSRPSLGDDIAPIPEQRKEYVLVVVDNDKKTAERVDHLARPLSFPMVQGGYLGIMPGKGKTWDILLTAFGGKQYPIANVTSTCRPVLKPMSEQAFLAETCLPYSSDHLMLAYTVEGKKLWEQLWQSRFTWGTFSYSETGNRFAYGSVEVNHNLAALDPVDESSIIGQPVGIFNVATGKVDTVLEASPILSAGENFALSPDGDRLAILRDGAIEIYDLPPVSPPAVATTKPAHP